VAVGVADGDTDLLAEGLALSLGDRPAVLRDEVAGVGEVGCAGENDVGTAEGADPEEQADTAAEASMVMVLQPMTANHALSPVPAMVVRTLMAPPHPSGQMAAPRPGPGTRSQRRRETRPAAARAGRRQVPETATAIKLRRPRTAQTCDDQIILKYEVTRADHTGEGAGRNDSIGGC
jgi:hypothetical protein